MLSKLKRWCLIWLASRTREPTPHCSTQGVTLIELLMTIVVIGILSAIASSTLINTSARAKEAEAKTTVAAILKAQQMHYVEKGTFVTGIDALALGIDSQTPTYNYEAYHPSDGDAPHFDREGNQVPDLAVISAKPKTDVKGYMGKAWLGADPGTAVVQTVLCEGQIGQIYFMENKTYCH